MQSTGQKNYKRKEITYFDGLNAIVSNNIAKKEELAHCENVRSPMIGNLEKREGSETIGTALTATTNSGVFYFNNSGTNNAGLYRISKVSGVNTIYYLKSVSAVAFTGSGLNDCTSSGAYTGTSASATFTVIIDGTGATNTFKWKKNSGTYTTGVAMTGSAQTLSDGVAVTFAATAGHTAADQWVITTNVWTALTGSGTGFSDPTGNFDTCIAEGNLYIVNGAIENRYISGSDGTTVTVTSTAGYAHNLLRSPKANLVNYYKGRLYLADFYEGSNRQKNTILRSSTQLGILALVNKDCAVGATSIDVTDTKYIVTGETIDIRRGGASITTVTVSAVTETSITVGATAVAINSADELWVNNTYGGAGKVFRWVTNSSYSGVNVKDYDTFKLSSTTDNDAEEVKMMVNVGNNMLLGSNNNLAVWNDYVLKTMDYGIGCVSKKGYIKCGGSLFFLHYTGIYQTEGDVPQIISTKIERYITGATRTGLEATAAGKKGRNVFFAIGDVTLKNPDGSVDKVLHDVCLEYSITQKNWYVHTNVKAKEFATFINTTEPDTLAMMTTESNYPIVEFLKSGVYTDNGTEINFRADTPNMLFGSLFEKISYPHEVVIEMERGAGLKAFVSLDMSNWYEVNGSASKGLTILKINAKDPNDPNPVRCRNMRISLRHTEKQLCKISKLAINYMTSAEEEVERLDETQTGTPYSTT